MNSYLLTEKSLPLNSFGGYNSFKLTLFPDTARALQIALDLIQRDLTTTLGLGE